MTDPGLNPGIKVKTLFSLHFFLRNPVSSWFEVLTLTSPLISLVLVARTQFLPRLQPPFNFTGLKILIPYPSLFSSQKWAFCPQTQPNPLKSTTYSNILPCRTSMFYQTHRDRRSVLIVLSPDLCPWHCHSFIWSVYFQILVPSPFSEK